MVKNAIQEPTTTAAPNFVVGALSGGKDFVEKQVGARKEEIMHTVGDLAEKVGVSRTIAEAVGVNLLEHGIKKGKEILTGHAVMEDKEKAQADPNTSKAIKSGAGSIEVNSAGAGNEVVDTVARHDDMNEVGDKSHTVGAEGGDSDVEPPMVMKKIDLKKDNVHN